MSAPLNRNAAKSIHRIWKQINKGYFFSRHFSKSSNVCSVPEYDLVVIGGGSGGLACAKEASQVGGAKVAVLDWVEPSPQGTKWGLGGTCVNVGCIPKKLMHHAALLGEHIHDSKKYGWKIPEDVEHNWDIMSVNVQNHVRSLNWAHRVALKDKNVDYFNAKGSLIDAHTVKCVTANGKESTLNAKNIVLATGMRPVFPDVNGAQEHCITSDDIFWRKDPPGKTLLIGASYVSLECAGFLTGLGYDVSVMIRSIPLRGFDTQMANLVLDGMKQHGTRILQPVVPSSIEKTSCGRFNVKWNGEDNQQNEEEYDTVMMAIGRSPETSSLGLEAAGVDVNSETGYIIGNHCGDSERTSVPHIYAIGDILEGGLELTPVAIQAGRMLARRLFNNSYQRMNYNLVPTTVFTPNEYSCVGLSEDDALEKYGEDDIEVYHAFLKPTEYTVSGRGYEQCYVKAVAERYDEQKILGLHYIGPNAGEIMQGFAAAMRCGLTMKELSETVGIHPTVAEKIVDLSITKRSGLDPQPTGC